MGITVKKIHKHRGKRWTVSVAGDFGREMFEWLSDNFGEEDFESGPWAIVNEQANFYHPDRVNTYDITCEEIIIMLKLRWAQ